MRMARAALIWVGLAVALAVPLGAAATSPLLQWRDPVYIAAGFAGVVALALLLVQPLMAAGLVPGLQGGTGRRLHRWVGAFLVLSVVIHVAGLWVTSPPDIVDALLLVAPTPFAFWGVAAMWALFASAAMVAMRRRLRLRWQTWRVGHRSLAVVIVTGTVVHALLIDGTMESISKAALCVLVMAATLWALIALRARPRAAPG